MHDGKNVSQENDNGAYTLGCPIFALFLSFSLSFFILCSNVIKSCQKKFGVNWRSFDPPTGGSYFIWEFQEKYKGNFKKIENSPFLLNFSCYFFLKSIFAIARIGCNNISKHFTQIRMVWHF